MIRNIFEVIGFGILALPDTWACSNTQLIKFKFACRIHELVKTKKVCRMRALCGGLATGDSFKQKVIKYHNCTVSVLVPVVM